MESSKIKVLAIVLPQFHPTKENNNWWGKGFTEWINVTKAKPLFKAHYQPHLPAELGFYDLRLAQSRLAQEQMAKDYGVYGFCYYHYWFKGKRMLYEPLDRKLKNKDEDFPFMLFWANETWSRRWLGEEKEILIQQTYTEADDYEHAKWLCETVFKDQRYITVNDKPAFVFYRPQDLPDYKKTLKIFRDTAKRFGFNDLYLIGSNSHTQKLEGFDHILNFEPQLSLLPGAFNDGPSLKKWVNNLKLGVHSCSLKLYKYSKVKKLMCSKPLSYKFLPCIFVGWDNTARRGKKGIIIMGANKNDFKDSLYWAKQIVKNYPEEEQLVFINAWNEWAEGNHLEPDIANGLQFLEAVKDVFNE